VHTGKHWKAPNGAVVLNLKDGGQGVMISAFQSRELGFGVQIDEHELTFVNTYQNGKDYCDKKAAVKLRGTSKKTGTCQITICKGI
jgi:hypothetical protein